MNHHTIHQGLEGMMNIDAFERRYKQTLLLCEAVELLSPYQLPQATGEILFVDGRGLEDPETFLQFLQDLSSQKLIVVLMDEERLLQRYCVSIEQSLSTHQCFWLLWLCFMMMFAFVFGMHYRHDDLHYKQAMTIPQAIGVSSKKNVILHPRSKDTLYTSNAHYRLCGLSYDHKHYQMNTTLRIYDETKSVTQVIKGRLPKKAYEIVLPMNTALKLHIDHLPSFPLTVYYARGRKVRGTNVIVSGLVKRETHDVFYSTPNSSCTRISQAFHQKVKPDYGIIYTSGKMDQGYRFYQSHYPWYTFRRLDVAQRNKTLDMFCAVLGESAFFMLMLGMLCLRKQRVKKLLSVSVFAYGSSLLLMAMIVSLFKMQVQASSINQAFTLSIDLKPYILILVLLTLTSCITHLRS